MKFEIGNFIEIDSNNKNTQIYQKFRKYTIKVIDIAHEPKEFLEGIIVEAFLNSVLFKKRKVFLKNNLKNIKKITDLNKIQELEIKYKLHLLKNS